MKTYTDIAIDLVTESGKTTFKKKEILTAGEIAGLRVDDIYRNLLKPEFRVEGERGVYDISSISGEYKPEPKPWYFDSVTGRPVLMTSKDALSREHYREFNELYEAWFDDWTDSSANSFDDERDDIALIDFIDEEDVNPLDFVSDSYNEMISNDLIEY